MASVIIGIGPFQFIHVLDLNTNVSYVETGPCTFVQSANEKVLGGPYPFVVVPPGHYCVIKDPCRNYVKGEIAKLQHGHTSVKFHGEPFPLIPGETLQDAEKFASALFTDYKKAIKHLPIIRSNHAIRLRALVDHDDGIKQRKAGDIWQLEGPRTYKPTPEAEILGTRKPEILLIGEALRLVAKEDFTARSGRKRVTGEEWLVQQTGAYLPDTFEEVLKKEQASVLEQNKGVYLRATVNLTDSLKKKRQAGEEWLVTCDDTEMLYPQIGVEVLMFVKKTILNRGQYCIVLDPVNAEGRPQLGKREVRCGISSFFLHPGESLLLGIQESLILGEDEAVVLEAREDFKDKRTEGSPLRTSGERWMIRGPTEYIESVEVAIIDKRKAIPLSKNEGIYVRNIQTGTVRTIHGPQSYLLTEYEELFKKELPDGVDNLLAKGGGDGAGDIRKIAYFEQSIDPQILKGRDKTRVVTYRCPGNTACQVYNYRLKTARVVFGPDLVVLGPHENFNVLSLSAGKPKKANAMKSLCLMLGPDFISDIIVVETSDHARLQIQLAFNNRFEFDAEDEASAAKLFAVPDFIGFACRQVAGKIRSTVAQCAFDEFHRNSSSIIQHAVFGVDAQGKVLNQLKFDVNNLVISSIDVQSIEPVDTRMRDSLMKSVQMAIEIATSSIEASAQHEAERLEQVARGQLERQKLKNEKESEKERLILNEIRAITAAVESTGQAVAEAKANAESSLIEAMSQIECTRLKSEAEKIQHSAELTALNNARSAETKYTKEQNEVEIHKTREFAKIEVTRLAAMINTVGQDTLLAIATSGPETQVKLLQGLGIKTTMITDGSTPVNLFSVAKGLLGQ